MAIIDGTTGSDELIGLNDGDVLRGLDGIDVLSAYGDNITLEGGPGIDELYGFGANTTASYENAAGGVTVNLSLGFAANDGDGSVDYFDGIQNVTGSAYADSLTGDEFANVLTGGAGNDTLTGNGGADVFQYSFDLDQGSGDGTTTTYTFTDWLSAKYDTDFGDYLPDYVPPVHDKGGKDDKGGKNDHKQGGQDDKGAKNDHKKGGQDDGHHNHGDSQSADTGLTQDFFSKNYTEWLKVVVVADLLAQGRELDVNGDGKIDIGLNQNDPAGTPFIEGLDAEQLAGMFSELGRDGVVLKTGKHAQERFYSNEFTSASGGETTTTVTSGDGLDTILDFNPGQDKLNFSGINQQDFLDYFNVAPGADTVITIDGFAGWSVTLVGVSDFALTDAVFSA